MWFTILTLFFGTNLYYYAIDSTGMSHIYSFALFALVAWLTRMILSGETKRTYLYLICWSLIFALIVLIRPSNILLFPFLFCLDCNSSAEFIRRVKRFLSFRVILILLVSSFVVFLPQFLYWKYVFGSYITDSYQGFGFSNWKSPKILELWFSPNNGLFLYSPLYLAFIAGLLLMIKHKIRNGWVILITFLVATYIFASWFIFSFGCGFGSRNYVEFLVLFSLPLGYIYSLIPEFRIGKRYLIILLIFGLSIFNLRLVYTYNRCFQGGDWNFQEYVSFLVKIRKYHQSLDMKGQEHMAPENEYSKTLYLEAGKIHYLKYKKAVVRAEVTLESKDSEAALVLAIETPDTKLYWNAFRLKDQVADSKLHKKQTVEGEFWIPASIPKNATIAAYIWNKNKETLTVSEFDLYLE